MPDRKVELFNVEIVKDYISNQEFVQAYDEDANLYKIRKDELIIEDK